MKIIIILFAYLITHLLKLPISLCSRNLQNLAYESAYTVRSSSKSVSVSEPEPKWEVRI